MSEAEVARFHQHPNLEAIVRVRLWDEAAKDPEVETPSVYYDAPLLQRVADRQVGAESRTIH